MNKSILKEVCAALLILLFLYSSVSKLIDIKGFASDMRNQVFTMSMAGVLTWVVPSLELAIVFCLWVEKLRWLGFVLASAVMAAFTLYTATVLAHFYGRIPCSCGGVIKKLSWGQHLFLNLFYLMVALLGAILQKRSSGESNTPLQKPNILLQRSGEAENL